MFGSLKTDVLVCLILMPIVGPTLLIQPTGDVWAMAESADLYTILRSAGWSAIFGTIFIAVTSTAQAALQGLKTQSN